MKLYGAERGTKESRSAAQNTPPVEQCRKHAYGT